HRDDRRPLVNLKNLVITRIHMRRVYWAMWGGLLPLIAACAGAPQTTTPAKGHESSPTAHDSSAATIEPPEPLPAMLRVILVEALIAPVKSDGRPWDMGGADSDAALKAV